MLHRWCVGLVIGTACVLASAHDGRRLEILVIDGKLYALGYDSTGRDDGAGAVRSYYNAMHDHWTALPTGDGIASLPSFDVLAPGPLAGHGVTLTLTGGSKWVDPPQMPDDSTVPVLTPLGPGDEIFVINGSGFVTTEAPGALVLTDEVLPAGNQDLDLQYLTDQLPATPTIHVLEFVLSTDAPGVASSDPIRIILSPDGTNKLEKLHYSSLLLEAWFGVTLGCAPDLNDDGVLNFFDVSAFLALFNAQDPAADINGDGQFNFFDVSEFLALFDAGC